MKFGLYNSPLLLYRNKGVFYDENTWFKIYRDAILSMEEYGGIPEFRNDYRLFSLDGKFFGRGRVRDFGVPCSLSLTNIEFFIR